jgi:hypothetical protein
MNLGLSSNYAWQLGDPRGCPRGRVEAKVVGRALRTAAAVCGAQVHPTILPGSRKPGSTSKTLLHRLEATIDEIRPDSPKLSVNESLGNVYESSYEDM